MKSKNQTIGGLKLATIGCLLLVFVVFPILKLFFDFQEVPFSILTIGFFVLLTTCLHKPKVFAFGKTSLYTMLLLGYFLVHFFAKSQASVYEIEFWRILSFFVLFLVLYVQYHNYELIAFMGGLILVRYGFELAIGVLQFFEIITASKSSFFSVAGTFTSTNHYAIFLVAGIIVSVFAFISNPMKRNLFRILFLVLAVVSVILIAYLQSRTALLSLALLLTLYFCHHFELIQKFKKLSTSIKLISVASLLGFVFVVVFMLYNLKKDSAHGRLFSAKIITKEILKKPIFGHGLFSFESGYNTSKSNYFLSKQREWSEIKVADHISHAMNDYLEVTYEMGLLGLGLIILLFFTLMKSYALTSPEQKIGIGLLMLLSFSSITTTLISESTFAFLMLFGFLYVHIESKEDRAIDKSKLLKIATIALSGLLLMFGLVRIYAKFKVDGIDQQKDRITYKEANFWFPKIKDKGYYTYRHGLVLYHNFKKKKKGLRLMQKGVNRNKNVDLVRGLSFNYLFANNVEAAEKLMRFNIGNEPYLFQSRMDLATLLGKQKKHSKQIKTLKELIALPEKIPSKKVDSIKNKAKKQLQQLSESQ